MFRLKRFPTRRDVDFFVISGILFPYRRWLNPAEPNRLDAGMRVIGTACGDAGAISHSSTFEFIDPAVGDVSRQSRALSTKVFL